MIDGELLSAEQMQRSHGAFHHKTTLIPLDLSKVPGPLHALAPYAAFWGISDDYAREELVASAPSAVQKNLKAVFAARDDLLDGWLAGEEADSATPTREYVAFSAMRMAADSV